MTLDKRILKSEIVKHVGNDKFGVFQRQLLEELFAKEVSVAVRELIEEGKVSLNVDWNLVIP